MHKVLLCVGLYLFTTKECIFTTLSQVHNPPDSDAVDLSEWQLHIQHSDKEQLHLC